MAVAIFRGIEFTVSKYQYPSIQNFEIDVRAEAYVLRNKGKQAID